MYFNVNFNVFYTLIKVHLLVSELYIDTIHVQFNKSQFVVLYYVMTQVKTPVRLNVSNFNIFLPFT